jgi:hypothetical protein
MKSKFAITDNRSLRQKAKDFGASALFWKGRKKGMIQTMNIQWDDIRAVFFPKNFYEKYLYLGSIPWNEEGKLFKALEPLIIFMDYKAKPYWCPRWFLRFLHLFGSDNSIVRVRNFRLHNLHRKLTKGIFIYDYKTKWEWYDLRISVSGDEQIQNMADDIESSFYRRGEREDLKEAILKLNPARVKNFWSVTQDLRDELSALEEANSKK